MVCQLVGMAVDISYVRVDNGPLDLVRFFQRKLCQ
jgi:hypothetical protein